MFAPNSTFAKKARSQVHIIRQSLSISEAVALLVLILFAVVIVKPGIFSTYNPIDATGPQLSAPSASHWFGTDNLGRDVYARIVYGAVHSISGAVTAVLFGSIIGGLIGLIAGSTGGKIDILFCRFIDVLLSIPSLLLSLSLITLLGFGGLQVAVAVGVTSTAGFARLTRAQVVSIRQSDYIEAAFGSGARHFQAIYRHIIPNTLSTVVGYGALQFGHSLLQIATLGFLGYSVPPPTPEWGLMIADGRNYVATAWWLTVTPGLFIVILVLATHRISRTLTMKRL